MSARLPIVARRRARVRRRRLAARWRFSRREQRAAALMMLADSHYGGVWGWAP